jgi:anti-sigma B factor antagonist
MGTENDATNDVLSISSRRDGTKVVVALEGELDLHGAGQLDAEIRRTLDAGPVSSIEIDATGLEFVDSSGLRSIMLARAEAEGVGATFRITSVSATVGRVIEIAGLSDLLLPAEPNPG